MSDPWISPSLRVLRVGRANVSPVVRLPSRAPSPVARIQVPGPIGPPGAAGHDGAGTDYGFIRYDEMAGLDPTPLLPGQLTPFVVTQPNIVRDKLRDVFAGHQFLDAGNVLRARADGDSYTVRPRLLIRAAQAGGNFQIGVVVQGNVSGINGFVLSSVASGANATVYYGRALTGLSGLTIGARYYLSATTPGAVTATPVSGAGKVDQYIGKAVSATEIAFEPDDYVVKAA